MHGCAIFLSANVSKYLSKRIYLEPSPAPLTASTNPRN
jgi:hypothetical protein